jgi:hypothetical protein
MGRIGEIGLPESFNGGIIKFPHTKTGRRDWGLEIGVRGFGGEI